MCKPFGLQSHYTSFIMFHQKRIIHTFTVVPKCNGTYLTNQKLTPFTRSAFICLIYPVLGQWTKFSRSTCLSLGLFSQFCTYMIFWPVIVTYCHTNLHMCIEPAKKLWSNYFGTPEHSCSMSNNTSCTNWLSFWYLTCKLVGHYTSFIMFHQNWIIHTYTAVPKCNVTYFTNQNLTPFTKTIYIWLMYPVLGQWMKFKLVHMPVTCVVFSVLYLYEFLTSNSKV